MTRKEITAVTRDEILELTSKRLDMMNSSMTTPDYYAGYRDALEDVTVDLMGLFTAHPEARD